MIAQEEVLSTARGTLDLWGAYSLADPLVLAAAPLAVVAFVWGRRRAARARGLVGVLPALPRTWRQRLGWLPSRLQLLAALLAIVALARPLRSNVESQMDAEGVDIALLVDRSGSMQFQDLEPGRSRLEVVKEVVASFAERRMTDRENAADSCALITFARYPRLLCPFTLDVDALQGFLQPVELVKRQEEDGTAIGVALAKAVAVLRESRARSRVAVLLTDGENNVEDIEPRAAAELAAEEGIKVYTVFAARHNYQYHPFQGWVPTSEPVDTRPLQEMAELTGAEFYRAADRQELEDIYARIEALEKTPRSERHYEESHDLYPWFLIPALCCAFLAQLSLATWARRVA